MNESLAIQKLISRIEISDQLKRYCYFFDSNDVNGLRTLFTIDAEIDYGPEVPLLVGQDAIMTSISRGLTSTFIATSHHLSNIIVEFEDEADWTADASAKPFRLRPNLPRSWERPSGGFVSANISVNAIMTH